MPHELAAIGLLGALILAVLWLALQVAQLRAQLAPLTNSGIARALAGT